MIAASRHCAKVDSASACGETWKSLALMKGRARERAPAPTVAKMAVLASHRRPPMTMLREYAMIWRVGAEVNCDGDGAPKDWSARADGACGALVEEDSDAPREPEPQPVWALAI